MAATPLEDHNCFPATADGGLSLQLSPALGLFVGKSGYAVAFGVPGLPSLYKG